MERAPDTGARQRVMCGHAVLRGQSAGCSRGAPGRGVIKETSTGVALRCWRTCSACCLLVSLAIKLNSRSPVVLTSSGFLDRPKDGRPFTMVKFRTMVVDADARGVTSVRWPDQVLGDVQTKERTQGDQGRWLAAAGTRWTRCSS